MTQVFQCPTKIYMCEDGLKEAGTIIKDLGYKKVFVLIGGGSVKKLGLLERLENSLKENEIDSLKQYLSETDYIITKLNEAKIEDENLFSSLKTEYSDILTKRKETRARINELENK